MVIASKANRIVKGSTLRMVQFASLIIVSFFLTPFIIHSLKNRMYGLWSVVGSITGFYSVFDFGLSLAVQRFVSKSIAQNNEKEANETINTSLVIFSLISIIVVFITLALVYFARLFVNNSAELPLFQEIFLLMGMSLALKFPVRVFYGVLTSHLRFDLVVYAGLILLALRTPLIVICLSKGLGILSLAIISVAMDIVENLIITVFSKKNAPYLRLSRKYIVKGRFKELFHFSTFSFIASIADKLRFEIDNFVIAGMMGLSFVTIYAIASRLIKYYMGFMIQIGGVLLPVFSQFEAQNDYQSLREKLLLSTKICSFISIYFAGLMIIFGDAFIRRWIGNDYANAYPVLVILTISWIFDLGQISSVQLLYGTSKHRFYAASNTVEGIANLVISLLLVKPLGLTGVALGTAIPMIINRLFVLPVYVCKVVKLSLLKYYQLFLFAFFKSLLVLLLSWEICSDYISANYFQLIKLGLLTTILFWGSIIIIGFHPKERRYILKILLDMWKKEPKANPI